MAVTNPPVWLQAGDYAASKYRRLVEALCSDVEGASADTGLVVTEKAGTQDMSVDVSAGSAFILGTENAYQGAYFVDARTLTNLAIPAADATNPRIDLIVAKVEDSEYAGVTDAWSLAVVEGTPAASPVAPSAPANSLTLAQVSVVASEVQITDAEITQLTPVWSGAVLNTAAIDDGAVSAAKLADDAVTTTKFAAGSVGSSELAADSVTAAKIADGAVTAAKIAAGAVTAVKVADGAVGTAAIVDDTVATADLADSAVTTVKIVDEAVTSAKLATGYAFTSTTVTGDFTLDSTTLGETQTFNPVLGSGWPTTSSEEGWYVRHGALVIFTVRVSFPTLAGDFAADEDNTNYVIFPVTPADAVEAAAGVTGYFYDNSSGEYASLIGMKETGGRTDAFSMGCGSSSVDLRYFTVQADQINDGAQLSINDVIVLSGAYRV